MQRKSSKTISGASSAAQRGPHKASPLSSLRRAEWWSSPFRAEIQILTPVFRSILGWALSRNSKAVGPNQRILEAPRRSKRREKLKEITGTDGNLENAGEFSSVIQPFADGKKRARARRTAWDPRPSASGEQHDMCGVRIQKPTVENQLGSWVRARPASGTSAPKTAATRFSERELREDSRPNSLQRFSLGQSGRI
jgi:hypothetical protein